MCSIRPFRTASFLCYFSVSSANVIFLEKFSLATKILPVLEQLIVHGLFITLVSIVFVISSYTVSLLVSSS